LESTVEERDQLVRWERRRKFSQALALRSRIVLACAEGRVNAVVAQECGVTRQLNKGEQLHALRRAIFYANEGHIRQRTPEQQAEQALCLAIVVNTIIAWNTVYTQRVLDELRAAGELITTSEIEHISPLAHQHIHLYGNYPFDLTSRPDGHRPLRNPPPSASRSPTETLNRV
jgi:hypothetical protein